MWYEMITKCYNYQDLTRHRQKAKLKSNKNCKNWPPKMVEKLVACTDV